MIDCMVFNAVFNSTAVISGGQCTYPCFPGVLLTHYQTTNFRLVQIERVCRRQFQISQKWQKVIQMDRKHCGKRRNCLLRAISPFPAVFSKDLYCRHVKSRACLGKG